MYSGLKVKLMSDKEFQGQIIQVNAGTKLPETVEEEEKTKFPFWGKVKFKKERPTLVIDEEDNVFDKKKNKNISMFVHREVKHSNEDGSNVKGLEQIVPNPNKNDKRAMYLKRPSKIAKKMIVPLGSNWSIPDHLVEKYSKNNKKE